MTTSVYLDRIVGHLGAAAVQRSFHDDAIIASHIDEALAAARALKAELETLRRRERDEGIALGHDQAEKYSSLMAGK